jgi:hypothetical protein
MRAAYSPSQASTAYNSKRYIHLTMTLKAPYNEAVNRASIGSPLGVLSLWGRHGFDGGKDSRDACRAPSPRKSDGHNVTADTQLALAA